MDYLLIKYLSQGAFALLCVVGFAIMFNIPRRLIPITAINGMLGWMLYLFFQQTSVSFIVPPFLAAILVGILGEMSAIWKKQPATIFIIPAIIPLVPGYGIYYTMLHIVEDNFTKAGKIGIESMFIAISIACGVVIASSFVRMIKPWFERKLSKT